MNPSVLVAGVGNIFLSDDGSVWRWLRDLP